MNILISVVVPCYRCAATISELVKRLEASLQPISSEYEIILINDASPDNDWNEIKKQTALSDKVKGVDLSRNFGQHYAITAGLEHASGEWIVVMDGDLQDQPEEIAKLYNRGVNDGFDVVFARRTARKDSFLKKMSSKLFYLVFNYLTESSYDGSVANFSISKRNVIESMLRLREHNRLFPVFISWVGFDVSYVDVIHAKREEGESSYNLKKLIKLSTDIIIAQSNKPLRLTIKFGFVMTLLSFATGIYYIARYFIHDIPVQGWTSVIVSMYFLAGLTFAIMGVIGLYISKTFDETKNRPLYIIKEKTWEAN